MKKLAACIVETRKEINLIKVINDHLKFLPKYTELFVFHGRSHRFLKTIFPKARLIEITYEMNEQAYNSLLTSSEFWEQFLNYSKILIFQHDSMILRGGIEEFLNMDVDYLGAPWKFPPYRGNGGVSLRTPKIMYEVCKDMKWDTTLGNEDIAICNHMLRYGIGVLGEIEQCERFACESIFKLNTWAYHAIDKWLTPTECEQIKNQYLTNVEYSINEYAERIVGKRLPVNGILIDQPSELGYCCPVCKNQPYSKEYDIFDDRLQISEYNAFLWCGVCNRDYPSTLCQPNIDKAIQIFLESVHNAKNNADK